MCELSSAPRVASAEPSLSISLYTRLAIAKALFAAGAPAYTQSIVAWERNWTRYYARLRIPVELRRAIDRSTLATGEAAIEAARGALVAFVSALTYAPFLVLIPILAFLLLKDAANVSRIVIKALPKSGQLRGHRPDWSQRQNIR